MNISSVVRTGLYFMTAAMLGISSCTTTSPRFGSPGTRAPGGDPVVDGHQLQGVASYYADDFHGRTTANGERYDMHGLTAAHRTLPFNTKVRVRNLDNGLSIVVRINDRGPFKDNRVIDLSLGAALKIGLIAHGTAAVQLELMTEESSGN